MMECSSNGKCLKAQQQTTCINTGDNIINTLEREKYSGSNEDRK